jgi:hypothetical protein
MPPEYSAVKLRYETRKEQVDGCTLFGREAD